MNFLAGGRLQGEDKIIIIWLCLCISWCKLEKDAKVRFVTDRAPLKIVNTLILFGFITTYVFLHGYPILASAESRGVSHQLKYIVRIICFITWSFLLFLQWPTKNMGLPCICIVTVKQRYFLYRCCVIFWWIRNEKNNLVFLVAQFAVLNFYYFYHWPQRKSAVLSRVFVVVISK